MKKYEKILKKYYHIVHNHGIIKKKVEYRSDITTKVVYKRKEESPVSAQKLSVKR